MDMGRVIGRPAVLLILSIGPILAAPALGQTVKLIERAPDPHGSPRPARAARAVPLRTSFYLELGMPADAKTGAVDPESVAVRLRPEGGEAVALLQPGRRFVAGG